VASSGDYSLELWSEEKKLTSTSIYLEKGEHSIVQPFVIENPQRWWTHDLGTPFLYHFDLKLFHKGQLLNVQSKKIGLRTIKIVQEPDKDGASFYVELNGRPIFAKGANYIPSDVFIPRVTDQQYQWLIHSTANANMNIKLVCQNILSAEYCKFVYFKCPAREFRRHTPFKHMKLLIEKLTHLTI
jgi:beta-mannosidase